MAKMRRRVRTLCNQLGIPLPEAVFALFEEDAEQTAEIVRLALSDILDEIKGKSSTGTLENYKAIKIPVQERQEVILPQTRFSVVGNFEWFIYVETTDPVHLALNINVFDALDQGRPALPKRRPSEGPYPMWNREFANVSDPRIKGSSRRLQIGGSTQGRAVYRDTERYRTQKPPAYLEVPASMGPLRAVPALNLYDAALRRAKDRISVKGLSRRWDVIKVGFK